MIRARPKRAVSSNVDYNLRKSKIIKEEDNDTRGLKKHKMQLVSGARQHENENSPDEGTPTSEVQPVISQKVSGEMEFNEPSISEPVNGVTGIPLSEFPNDKVKKESLWNVKVNKEIPKDIEDRYKGTLVRYEGDDEDSFLRSQVVPKDIHAEERLASATVKRKYGAAVGKRPVGRPPSSGLSAKHKRIKAIKDNDSKLFGQNSTANHAHLPELKAPGNDIENEDFCSACLQTGIFLCCDTCPKSFHFACLNPPVDPDNLPEGDWSCNECKFKQMNPNKTALVKNEKHFLSENNGVRGVSMFGKLLFQLKSMNSRQFVLSQQIKDTFANVHTGPHGEYQDDTMKEPLTDRQLFNAPYGQSITKFDSYNPDTHLSNSDDQEFLICYKCNTTKMGTWDRPENERFIMKCDYCGVPWHLDCLPVPRASHKNLGSKWMCPLHATPPVKKRRLARNQEYNPLPLGGSNSGDVEITLDAVPIVAPLGKEMERAWQNENKYSSIPQLQEHNVKLEFLDKVYRAKQAQRLDEFREQSYLIDKMLCSFPEENTKPWLYFSLPDSSKKLWDFQELCKVANSEISKEEMGTSEIRQLQLLKKLIESKPRNEVMSFFGLNE